MERTSENEQDGEPTYFSSTRSASPNVEIADLKGGDNKSEKKKPISKLSDSEILSLSYDILKEMSFDRAKYWDVLTYVELADKKQIKGFINMVVV